MLPTAVALPPIDTALVTLSNVNPDVASAEPSVLKITCVVNPGTVRLPEILPAKLPTKYDAITLELVVMLPMKPAEIPAKLLPVILPDADIVLAVKYPDYVGK